ncbi:hypothetical protein N7541_010918 [Penicillium brevicompactum]|uniref:Uncharacterized protein n=1 Tax=Penicillium brevicompactum TaxID=5074 RepID=A0A9W9UIN3_PENBR|nr:hypothetical protein N7541_010918 [Penicillium brevicompactum]
MGEPKITVDPDYYDLFGGDSDVSSGTTSLASSIYRGVFENGRRYQTVREGEYWCPCDEQQFESLLASHLLCVVLDSKNENPLFHAPVREPKEILDIGTGRGSWAVDVADMFPETTVRGVDLFPPPIDWLPPNCIMEVDDILKEWTWRKSFDLIHLRQMVGAFTPKEWDSVFEQCYKNLKPGGWIEQLEVDPHIICTDGTLPANSSAVQFAEAIISAAKQANQPIDTVDTMRGRMSKLGFIDIHEKKYNWPMGPWPRDPLLKEAGRLHYHQWMHGMEGWAMYYLTKWGTPSPWSPDEVQVLVAKARKELKDGRAHMWQYAKRVWARKPTEEEMFEIQSPRGEPIKNEFEV